MNIAKMTALERVDALRDVEKSIESLMSWVESECHKYDQGDIISSLENALDETKSAILLLNDKAECEARREEAALRSEARYMSGL